MHLAPDELALLAIGDGDDTSRNHLKTCSVCRDEADSLGAVSAILAAGGPIPVRAPDHVWTAIAAAVALDSAPAADPPLTLISDDPDVPTPAPLLERRRRRRSGYSGLSLLGAAAAGAAAVWVGSLVFAATEQPSEDMVASAQLAPMTDTVAAGEADIYERDGQRVLRLNTDSLPEVSDGYLEVWLLGDDAAGMVTLGTLAPGSDEFVLPQGLSTDTFATVDVSIEHYDGDPMHSGESLWRGPLASS